MSNSVGTPSPPVFTSPTLLPDGYVLDSITLSGFYIVKNPNTGLLPGTFLVEIVQGNDSAIALAKQTATNMSTGDEFVRVLVPYTGWGSWVKRYNPGAVAVPAASANFLYKADLTSMWAAAPNLTSVVGVYTDANANVAIPLTDAYGTARNSPNLVWSMGWNFDSNGARLDTTKPAFGLALEDNYFIATSAGMKRGVEGHWKLQLPGGTFDERRIMSFWMPWDGGVGSILSFQSDQFNFSKFNGQGRLSFDWTGATGIVNFLTPTQIYFSTNNTVNMRQMNAAGTDMKYLWYLDSYDRMVSNGSPIAIGGATPDGQQNAIFSIFGCNMADTKFITNWSFPNAVTGTVRGNYIGGQASVAIEREIWNYGTGNAVDRLKTSAGAAFNQYWLNNVGTWSEGATYDNVFRISRSATLGTNDVLSADANSVAFGIPAKLKSYTVSTLPSASTAGAGAMAFVTDANATTRLSTVAGGGSNKLPVFSDGTNWLLL